MSANNKLKERTLLIKLVKISGHSGIRGNELADQKAKEVALDISKGRVKAPRVISISDARKVSTDIAMKSWQRKWNEESKGRYTYELIPVVGTKVLWPRTRDIGISYGRMLLHDTILNDDSYRTGTAETPVCDCGQDNETVSNLLLHCSRYTDAIQCLHDTIDDIYSSTISAHTVFDKVNFIIAPPCDNNVKKKDNIFVKEALFQFINSIDRRL